MFVLESVGKDFSSVGTAFTRGLARIHSTPQLISMLEFYLNEIEFLHTSDLKDFGCHRVPKLAVITILADIHHCYRVKYSHPSSTSHSHPPFPLPHPFLFFFFYCLLCFPMITPILIPILDHSFPASSCWCFMSPFYVFLSSFLPTFLPSFPLPVCSRF